MPFFRVNDQYLRAKFLDDFTCFQNDFVWTVDVLLKGDCSVSVPRKKLTLDEKVVLSAKISTIAEGIWLMKVRNKRGPRMLP